MLNWIESMSSRLLASYRNYLSLSRCHNIFKIMYEHATSLIIYFSSIHNKFYCGVKRASEREKARERERERGPENFQIGTNCSKRGKLPRWVSYRRHDSTFASLCLYNSITSRSLSRSLSVYFSFSFSFFVKIFFAAIFSTQDPQKLIYNGCEKRFLPLFACARM